MPAFIPIDLNRFKELYSQKLGEREIAKKLGVSRSKITSTRHKLGLPPNKKKLKVDIGKLAKLVEKGYTDKYIADELRCKKDLVRYHRNSLGVSRTKEGMQKVYSETYRYYDIFSDTSMLQVITGTLLGDAWIYNGSNTSSRLGFGHKEANKDYVYYKANLLEKICSSISYKLVKPSILDGRTIIGTNQFWFRSKSNPGLRKIRDLLYKESKKVITKEYLSMMGELSLALYYFDDGSKIKGPKNSNFYAYKIAMYAFSRESKQVFAAWLKGFLGVETCIRPNDIYIRANSREKFKSIINKYVVESMRYKI